MDWEMIDWPALERLRAAFLAGSAGEQDYWESERDLASYDLTFAQRIGWKWDHVLGELSKSGWQPPQGPVLDWGCGSGVAGRAFLDQFGTEQRELLLWDRSELAVSFARKRAQERFPELDARKADLNHDEFQVLLLSHVLTELPSAELERLLDLVSRANSVLWVEPGTREVSRKLIGARERLRSLFHLVAPCPHQGPCGILAPQNAPHWCHHFAEPPPDVFTNADWARFGKLAGVDLRSLPLSFLVLDKRPIVAPSSGTVRLIGRPRVYKAHALLFGCDATGVRERQLTKRDSPEQFRAARKGTLESRMRWDEGTNGLKG